MQELDKHIHTAHSAMLCCTMHEQMIMYCNLMHIPSFFELLGYMQRAVSYNMVKTVNHGLNAGLKMGAAGYPLAAIT